MHKHEDYSEAFVVLKGALAFFVFNEDGSEFACHVLQEEGSAADRAIVVEKTQYHAMAAAPIALGWPGHAIVFETSGHVFDTSKPTKVFALIRIYHLVTNCPMMKVLAPFAPVLGDGLNGSPEYFTKIFKSCPRK